MTAAERRATTGGDGLAARVVDAGETAAALCRRAAELVAEAATTRSTVRRRRERRHVHVRVGRHLDVLDRVAANELLFRRANAELAFAGGAIEPRAAQPFLCECSDLRCGELVDVALGTYVAHTAFPNRFLVTHRCALLSLAHEPTLIVEWETGFAVIDRAEGFVVSEEPELKARERRWAENEAVFRAVNAQVERLIDAGASLLFVCECADDRCRERLDLSVAEYEAVRREPNRYVVKPGHERDAIETVVAANERYAVVDKTLPGPPG